MQYEDSQKVESETKSITYYRRNKLDIIKCIRNKSNGRYSNQKVFHTPNGVEWLPCFSDSLPHDVMVAFRELH